MRRSSTARPVLPADWAEVLGRVQQTLQEADAAAARRVEGLENPSGNTDPATTPEPIWRCGLEQARQRLDLLATYADRAGHAIAETDMALGIGEDSLRGWLSASEAARRRLAEWVGRAVG